MHKISIPQFVRDRVLARRGRELSYEGLDPARTALVVVDMQNAFMLPEVAHTPCLEAVEIVPNINRLARAVRATGGTVVWIKTRFTEATLVEWATHYDLARPEYAAKRRAALSEGGLGFELWRDLETQPEDVTAVKYRYSAFLPGTCDLPDTLRARGIDTVLITGTVTNICCETTARDAMMQNFQTIMVTDGNAAMSDEEHNAALASFYFAFGDIMSTDKLIGCLERNARLSAAAE